MSPHEKLQETEHQHVLFSAAPGYTPSTLPVKCLNTDQKQKSEITFHNFKTGYSQTLTMVITQIKNT